MRLSLFTDYSLRVLMFAALKGESFSLSEVARQLSVALPTLHREVNRLVEAGLGIALKIDDGAARAAEAAFARRWGLSFRHGTG